MKNWFIVEFREYILSDEIMGEDLKRISWGLNSEIIVVVVKLMLNFDLVYVVNKVEILIKCNIIIG